MDQKTIVAGLMKALENGKGDLDALDALLDTAKSDIAKVKKAEAEAAAKRAAEEQENKRKFAEEIAELATRLLNGETTAADVALVTQTYMRAQGMENATVTAEEVTNGAESARELKGALDDLVNDLKDLFENFQKPASKCTCDPDPDQIIHDFLKDIGLR